MDNDKIKRTINFYELDFTYQDDFAPDDNDHFRELFSIIAKLAKTRAKIRYQQFGEKAIFVQDVKFEPANKVIVGKIRCVRKDILPEIMNTNTDEAKGIEAKEEEGLVETTHFVIDHSKKTKKLAIEYNQFGSKIGDFIAYIQNIGLNQKALKKAGFRPIVKDELSSIKERINRCSELVVKVHKDNIEEIQTLDDNLYSALKSSIEHFNSDYATLILKFDFKQRQETKEVNQSVFNIIKAFKKNQNKAYLFNTLQIRAEDSYKNDLLENFDLLIDKLKSEVNVLKKDRYRTVVSDDIFTKMKSELIRRKI